MCLRRVDTGLDQTCSELSTGGVLTTDRMVSCLGRTINSDGDVSNAATPL